MIESEIITAEEYEAERLEYQRARHRRNRAAYRARLKIAGIPEKRYRKEDNRINHRKGVVDIHRTIYGLCPNCLRVFPAIPASRRFCDNNCRAIAEFVRMARKWIITPRMQADPGYDDAMTARLTQLNAFAHGRSYIQNLPIPPKMRLYIFKRDKGQCRGCGAPGTEVDHINGLESVAENLQLLCHDCNIAKAIQTSTQAMDNDIKMRFDIMYTGLGNRAISYLPAKACDDEQNWGKVWRDWPHNYIVVEYVPQPRCKEDFLLLMHRMKTTATAKGLSNLDDEIVANLYKPVVNS